MKRLSIAIYTLIIVNIWTALSSCSVSDESSKMNSARSIEFGVMVSETKAVKSRALDSVYVNSAAYPCNFYIESTGTNNDTLFSDFGTYKVSSSIEGLLECESSHKPLQWNGFKSYHTFYGWTLPWLDENYKPSGNPVPVTFDNSNGVSGYELNKNNERYETFIGSLVTDRNFDQTGKYVEMIFKHLVSKIKIDRFSLIGEDGSVQANLQANITFYGMPSEATFYPHPEEEGKWPEVIGEQPALDSGHEGVTFYIANGSNPDYAYICPELDFSKMYFSVELVNENYGKEGDYIGNFDNVEFIREAGTDFDKGKVDEKILHAGEMMTLNIVLYPGVGPGISILIQDWSTEELNETVHHIHPGIYTDDELLYIFEVFKRSKNSLDPATRGELERLAELYGEINDKGELVFPLYGDIDFNNNYLSIPRGCVIDGQGHTIIMKTNRYSHVHNNQIYYNIGPVRNVYLMDPNGEHRLYIDNDGVVWTYNEEKGQYIETENKLPPLDGDNYSYNISAETGAVAADPYYT